MKYFSEDDIQQLEKLFRINLINSCTGYKSANLLATKSEDGIENVAVFSSVIHLGSNPPLLGFILRPTTVARNTYDNLKKTKVFTVNHIHKNSIEDAHHTSAKYDGEISEFDKTNLNAEYKNEFFAPFVKGANVQIGCSFKNEYFIKENDCLLIVGAIKHLHIKENALQDDGYISLEKTHSVAINGLDGYTLPNLLARFEYARPKE
ncbi:MAG TPA: flavin oxidoreductase [Flavobacteriaceae bacterium]|jgi:flavin reductase (DIM6/NTAB) family NADH-FMN oxidoreductase RutF|nr:flavin oxidoreductase [Flavobacteriaceae bacterium]|tara:strand:- start:93698 stop:94315 length:618 start_codon:yes stop_codon:yes gene_type:complete